VRNNTNGDMGALKFTTQKFYRINGGSVQLEGVKSDLVVPGRFTYIDVGEKDKSNPLPYDIIDPVSYTPWQNYSDYDGAVKRSNKRISRNEQFNLIDRNAEWVKSKIDETVFSLNYENYKRDLAKNEEEAEQFDAISDYNTNLTFESTSYERNLFKQDTTDLKEKRNRWHQSLSQDVYIEEALNVLEDLKSVQPLKKVASAASSVKK